jgi:signal transduction histidine kinase
MAAKHSSSKETGAARPLGAMRPLYVQLVFVVLAFSLMVVSSCLYVNRMLRRHLKINAEDTLHQMEGEIWAYFIEPETALLAISRNIREIIMQGGDVKAVKNYIGEISGDLQGKTGGYDFAGLHCYLESLGGIFLPTGDFELPEHYEPKERPWYKAAVEAAGQIAMSPVYTNIRLNDYVVTYVRRVFDDQGTPLCIIGLNVPLARIRYDVVNMRLTKDGYGFLLDEHYTVIAHANENLVGQSLLEISPQFAATSKRLDQGINVSEFLGKNSRGETSIFFYRNLKNGWHLGLAALRDEYFFEVLEMSMIVSALGSILAAALILVLLRIDTEKTKADEANRLKNSFLANMSHELRTPLNVVIGLTDLTLEDANLAAKASDNLHKISNAGNTLLSIVNDLLDFSKIELGKLELSPVEYHVSSLLNDVVTLAVTRLSEKPVKLHLDVNEDIPCKLYGDDLHVKQIFNNLLSNALKYTHTGAVKLSVNCTRDGTGDIWLEITVNDTGIGIRKEDMAKLFNAYYQVDPRASRRIEGTGLGLSITKKLAEMMDGEVSVESEFGKGSSFHVKIRQGFVSDETIGPTVAENLKSFSYGADKRSTAKKLVRHDLSYARVLVVDDMQTNLDVAMGLLVKYKMQVDCVTSGQAAIERIGRGDPVYNAVFMDHMMPGMDGVEAAAGIRRLGSEYAQKLPIIALTANATHGVKEMFLQHGFQAFISKPIDIMELDSIVRKCIRDNSHLHK